MGGRLLLQLLDQQRPLQPHPHNTPFRPINFDRKHIILSLNITDLALEVLAFRTVPRLFGSRIRRMMSPRFLFSAPHYTNMQERAPEEGDRDIRGHTAKFGWVGDGAAMLCSVNERTAQRRNRERFGWSGQTRISIDFRTLGGWHELLLYIQGL